MMTPPPPSAGIWIISTAGRPDSVPRTTRPGPTARFLESTTTCTSTTTRPPQVSTAQSACTTLKKNRGDYYCGFAAPHILQCRSCMRPYLAATNIHPSDHAGHFSIAPEDFARDTAPVPPTVSAAAAPRVLPVLPRARLPRNPSRPGSARRPPARTRELAARRAAVASVASPRRRRPLVSPSRGLHRLLTPRAPRSPSSSTADSLFPPARGPRRHAPSRAEPTTTTSSTREKPHPYPTPPRRQGRRPDRVAGRARHAAVAADAGVP
jgi:hypothetical protein